MAKLAIHLHEEGHQLNNPIKFINKGREKKGVKSSKCSELEAPEDCSVIKNEISSEEDLNKEDLNPEDSTKEEDTEEETEPFTMTGTPKEPSKQNQPDPRSPSCVHVESIPSGAASWDPVPHQTMSGHWQNFDFFNSFKRHGCIVICMIIHNGVQNASDVEVEWINPRCMKICICWPEWFASVLQMMDFHVTSGNGNAVPKHDRQHLLTLAFAENAATCFGGQNQVWDKGFFSSDSNMDVDEDTTEIELLKVTVGLRTVPMVQITAEENQEAESKKKCTVLREM